MTTLANADTQRVRVPQWIPTVYSNGVVDQSSTAKDIQRSSHERIRILKLSIVLSDEEKRRIESFVPQELSIASSYNRRMENKAFARRNILLGNSEILCISVVDGRHVQCQNEDTFHLPVFRILKREKL